MTLHVCTIVTEYGISLANHSHLQMQSNTWALEEDERSAYYNCLLTEHENNIFLLKKKKHDVYFPGTALSFKKQKVVLTLPLFQ